MHWCHWFALSSLFWRKSNLPFHLWPNQTQNCEMHLWSCELGIPNRSSVELEPNPNLHCSVRFPSLIWTKMPAVFAGLDSVGWLYRHRTFCPCMSPSNISPTYPHLNVKKSCQWYRFKVRVRNMVSKFFSRLTTGGCSKMSLTRLYG